MVHEKMYAADNLAELPLDSYIHDLCSEILESLGKSNNVKLIITGDNPSFEVKKLVPLALIFNELVTNSIKHGFREKELGAITVQIINNTDTLEIEYSDDGDWFDNPRTSGFGTSLIEVFIEQLDGEFKLNKKDKGTKYSFQFRHAA